MTCWFKVIACGDAYKAATPAVPMAEEVEAPYKFDDIWGTEGLLDEVSRANYVLAPKPTLPPTWPWFFYVELDPVVGSPIISTASLFSFG